MAPQSSPGPYTKVVNDTGLDYGDIAPAIISVTIQKSGNKRRGTNKGMAGAGLYAALLGATSFASPPSLSSTSWVVGIIGLLLAGQSTHDISQADDSKSHSRVLYLGDAASHAVDERNTNEIVMYRAHMDGNPLKITEYFVPSVGSFLYNASDIIKGCTHGGTLDREVKDLFTFTFPEPHVINLYRYVSIRGLSPMPSFGTDGSELPSNGLPKQGSLVWYDADRKFLAQWDSDKQEEIVDRFGAGWFDSNNKAIRRNLVSFVQEIKPQLSPNMAILHLSDKFNTPVLVLNNWRVSGTGDRAANVATQEEVMRFIKTDQRNWDWGYQWDSNGDIYPCSSPYYYRVDYMTRSEDSHLFFPLTDKDWTYTTMIVKKD
ncbi:hypothetical protein TsFJ059_006649 [Trichoderma semiorbis]|uniref:Uncharacterized protein n=1 Tax=Trichoderma semiorbis TaxID=1491008 RepID=A0A9P8KKP1_9HYPO|nr:hypothetical protein TsFJ059_006649 [Trichoderma semiorbis]